MYKLIAFDLDGTLLYDVSSLSEENYKALGELDKRGVLLVPTTGRAFYEIPKSVRDCPYFRYFITSGGACTYDSEGRLIDEALIMEEEWIALLNVLSEYDCFSIVHYGGYGCIDGSVDHESFDKYRLDKGFKLFIPLFSKPVDGFAEYCKSMREVELICSFFKNDEDKEGYKKKLKELGSYTIVASAKDNVEVLSGRADKGVSVLKLAEKFGIKREEVIGVGDSINDIELIKSAGLGIAMGNALQPLKAEADHIGCHHRDHIAKYILDKFIDKIKN